MFALLIMTNKKSLIVKVRSVAKQNSNEKKRCKIVDKLYAMVAVYNYTYIWLAINYTSNNLILLND